MNKKKLLMFGLPILALALVSALTYYVFFTASVTVHQPIGITYDGVLIEGQQGFNVNVPSCDAGKTCVSDKAITVSNSGDEERTVEIVQISVNPNIGVSYVGKMQFTQKDLNTWIALVSGITKNIEYTVTGDNFVVKGIPTEYTLIYYPNTVGDVFTTNVAGIKVLHEGSNDIGSLPMSSDVGDDYCNILNSLNNKANPTAKVCHGAKLWLVPTTALSGLQGGSWSEASNFLFETDLITYTDSTSGEILVPAKSTITFYPAFTPDQYIGGGTYDFGFEVQ